MGIYRKDYIIYGWKLPYHLNNKNGEKIDFWADKFLPMIEGHVNEEFSLIRDDMTGQYNAFGLRIKNSDEWDFFHLDFKNLDAEKVKSKYREIFELNENDLVSEPYLFIFSHFS